MKTREIKSNSENCRNCPVWKQSLFSSLSNEVLDDLSQFKASEIHKKGEHFFEKGEAADYIRCMRSGSAKVSLAPAISKSQSIVRIAGPGEVLGYRCVFSSSTFRGTTTALSESVSCRISTSTIIRLIEIDSKFSLEILRRMGLEIARAEQHLQSFCQKSVRERLAEALLILKDKFGEETPHGWRISLQMTRTDLSNWIGAAKETIIRCLKDFTDEGLIKKKSRSLYLKDLSALTEISGAPTEG
ncbi:MAG: Crp/Fnr family transcriptional regulator [Bdellovibrionales bacterium]|nr:Crp/Fnr family transcriptional regulator [Bdellovibrionales bacterium]